MNKSVAMLVINRRRPPIPRRTRQPYLQGRRFLFLAVGLLLTLGALRQTSITLLGEAMAPAAPRRIISLNGDWRFQTNGAPVEQWKTVRVPSTFETHEGTEFDGIGWYQKPVEPPSLTPGQRLLLQFHGAATETEVGWDGARLGSHLGGWTPFRFDVTDCVREAASEAGKDPPPPVAQFQGRETPRPDRHVIRVRVDEKVGHNTQGFLPIVQPHFGGIWQDVELLVVPETYINDLELRAAGNPASGKIELEIPIASSTAAKVEAITVRYRLPGAHRWKTFRVDTRNQEPSVAETTGRDDFPVFSDIQRQRVTRLYRLEIPVAKPRLWSPSEPNLYELEIRLASDAGRKSPGDAVRTRAAFRRIEAQGRKLVLNGKPLNVRGLLNWGYYPVHQRTSRPGHEATARPPNSELGCDLAPNPGDETIRQDLEFARSCGFNLMKFCLWVPPKRFLELADEIGLLAWMEYPTWHPQFTPEHLDDLRREFREFFCHDRNHPSVILRSLTCETGPGAERRVIQSLYDLAHRMIPGAVVEDDSSWIEWNRVSDIYDDHPYGNNHTWPGTLQRLNEYVAQHEPKPLVLGEAMAADTWAPFEPLLPVASPSHPYWFPGAFDDQQRWRERLRAVAGSEGLEALFPDSLRYAMLMRKYQAEAFRREVPDGGYVISVIRDVGTASMGLLDYRGKPKWPETDWAWQRDTLCLLRTDEDRRSFFSDERLRAEILVSHFGDRPLRQAQLRVTLEQLEPLRRIIRQVRTRGITQAPGSLARLCDLDFVLPSVRRPTRFVLRAVLRAPQGDWENEWPIWIVPRPAWPTVPPVRLHSSVATELAEELYPGARPWDDGSPSGVVVASRFDDPLVKLLENGGCVLFLPDGERASFPLSPHWFLRGGPYLPGHPLGRSIPRELLVELQHFDLASDVIPEVQYLENLAPVLMLWDTHDLRTVKTHGLVFETRAGKGRLLVSALRHRGAANAAGRWILQTLVDYLASGTPPQNGLSAAQWARIKEEIHEEEIPLIDSIWKFRPDPDEAGLSQGWQRPDLPEEAGWTNIRIGQAWESQGFPDLDKWAWYRLSVRVPGSWQGRRVYLSFEGVDDFYELYVNGRFVAKRGDLEMRKDTFNEKFSHDLTDFVRPGEDALIAVRVYDWYGAGGIFRAVSLGTTPFAAEGELLR